MRVGVGGGGGGRALSPRKELLQPNPTQEQYFKIFPLLEEKVKNISKPILQLALCNTIPSTNVLDESGTMLRNWLDFIIVSASIVEVVINAVEVAEGGVQDLSSITGFKIFRILRLTRIVKMVRLVRIFRFVSALRTLVTSIAHTLKALFWALTLLAMIVYVFAVLFSQVLHDHITDPTAPPLSADADEARIKYFGSLPETMLSLFMSIAGGVSWEDVIFPLKAVNLLWVFCFLFYVTWQKVCRVSQT